MVASQPFTRRTIAIQTKDPDTEKPFTRTEKGYVVGPIAIIDSGSRSVVGRWKVLHIATGLLVARGSGGFSRLAQARSYAIGLLAIPGAEDYLNRCTLNCVQPEYDGVNPITDAMRTYTRENKPK